MFRSVKSAVGWYAAFRRGPELAQLEIGPRIQESHKEPGDLWVRMAKLIAKVCHEHKVEVDDLVRWGSTADGAALSPGQKALKALRAALDAEQLLEAPVVPTKCDGYTFTVLNADQIAVGLHNVPDNIRRIREDVGLTQGELAEKAGCKRRWISKLENGIKAPTDSVLGRIADALGVTAPELLTSARDWSTVTTKRAKPT